MPAISSTFIVRLKHTDDHTNSRSAAHLPLLDRDHSSPVEVASRNNFLFNAICCVSARSYNVALWERLKGFAKTEMERLPLEKNIDASRMDLDGLGLMRFRSFRVI